MFHGCITVGYLKPQQHDEPPISCCDLQVMDFGYPQFTEAKILSEFIKTDAYKMEVQARPPMAVTNAVSWRSEGIKYKKNEVTAHIHTSVTHLLHTVYMQLQSLSAGRACNALTACCVLRARRCFWMWWRASTCW
jgi:hypothetical protein